MKTYWDYTDKERSLMTEEFVTTLLSAELMVKGVKKVSEFSPKEIQSNDEVSAVTKGVWDNWFECKVKAQNYQKLLDTKAEYEKITEGDAGLARTFLQKIYSDDEISAVELWFSAEAV